MKEQSNATVSSFITSLFEVSAQDLPSTLGLAHFSNAPANSSRQKKSRSAGDDDKMMQSDVVKLNSKSNCCLILFIWFPVTSLGSCT